MSRFFLLTAGVPTELLEREALGGGLPATYKQDCSGAPSSIRYGDRYEVIQGYQPADM